MLNAQSPSRGDFSARVPGPSIALRRPRRHARSDQIVRGIYWRKSDVGKVPTFGSAESTGHLNLLFEKFPLEKDVADATGSGIDVFFSKNTLKRGCIHPAQSVDPNRRIDLGADDEEFIKSVYDRLNPGGFFMMYNFHPKRTPPGEKYRTWSDGRSPFKQTDLEAAGFKVIQFDCDDTKAAHTIAKAVGLDKTWISKMTSARYIHCSVSRRLHEVGLLACQRTITNRP